MFSHCFIEALHDYWSYCDQRLISWLYCYFTNVVHNSGPISVQTLLYCFDLTERLFDQCWFFLQQAFHGVVFHRYDNFIVKIFEQFNVFCQFQLLADNILNVVIFFQYMFNNLNIIVKHTNLISTLSYTQNNVTNSIWKHIVTLFRVGRSSNSQLKTLNFKTCFTSSLFCLIILMVSYCHIPSTNIVVDLLVWILFNVKYLMVRNDRFIHVYGIGDQ